MSFAVVGAGFTGLAVCWHLFSLLPTAKIHLFDDKGVGGGASGIATGLLHPFAGAHSKLNPDGLEGFEASSSLIQAMQVESGTPIIIRQGMLRLATTEEQTTDYQNLASQREDVTWLSAKEIKERLPLAADVPGIFIEQALAINSKAYLDALFASCQAKGLQFTKKRIHSREELQSYDQIIFATGAETPAIEALQHLPINPLKGQLLEIEWPSKWAPLNYPLNSDGYLTPSGTEGVAIAGATFEREFTSVAPNLPYAVQEILPKMELLIPSLRSPLILSCKSGLRAMTPTRLPKIWTLPPKTSILSGMGSKGLLFHALFAKRLAHQLLPFN